MGQGISAAAAAACEARDRVRRRDSGRRPHRRRATTDHAALEVDRERRNAGRPRCRRVERCGRQPRRAEYRRRSNIDEALAEQARFGRRGLLVARRAMRSGGAEHGRTENRVDVNGAGAGCSGRRVRAIGKPHRHPEVGGECDQDQSRDPSPGEAQSSHITTNNSGSGRRAQSFAATTPICRDMWPPAHTEPAGGGHGRYLPLP